MNNSDKAQRKWRDADVDFLRANYLKMDNRQLAVQLGRSKSSIETKLSKLHLKRPEQQWMPVNRPSLQMHLIGLCGKLEARIEFALNLLSPAQ